MSEFALPHPLHNVRGEIRRVGVELEFTGMSLADAAEAVRLAYGGEARQEHEYRYVVATDLGEFDVTFDSSLLSTKKYERLGLGAAAKGAVEGVLRRLGGAVLPLEIGTPPIPGTRLQELSKLEEALRERHAEGTRAGLFYAFALHFNPEAVDTAAPAPTLRAFLLLYHWLYRQADVDSLRWALPFINSFPDDYTRLVIDPGYAPDIARFADDYVAHNPTRNRPLDLLPLLAFADPEFVNRPEVAGQKVRPRPTYHYRLPNSLIDDPNWSIAKEWGRWVLVERLAADAKLSAELARDYLEWEGSVAGYLEDRWVKHVEERWIPSLREPPRE
ncbi:MAG TPA: amidoligase family protein [Fimbriiglobus sp.]|nr:amidoligase family protein [Fimbriiglobus sp.]